jgi:hypothetical protein
MPMYKRWLALALILGTLVGFYFNPVELSVQIGKPAEPITVNTQARDLTLVCPGALYRTGGASGTSLKVSRAGSATLLGYFQAQGNLKLVERTLKGDTPTLAGRLSDSISEAKALTVQDPDGSAVQGSALLSASQAQVAKASNLAGLASANCIRPSSDSWLIGGDTSPGRETLLILSNPTNVDSTVNLEVIGSGGPVAAPGLSSISVPKSKTTVIPLAGLAPNLPTFAVHVVASGGALGAWLQTRTMRGLVAGGVEFVGPSIDPGTSLVIPGIYLRGVADAAKLIGLSSAYADLAPMLRVTSTSSKPATVTAQILGASAGTYGTVIQQVVAPNSTLDIPITGLLDGDYVAFIDSSEPVRAAIRFSRTKVEQTDFAWAPAVTPLAQKVILTAPVGAISKLAIANPGKSSAQVKIGSRTVTVPAASAISVLLSPGRAAALSSSQPVSASVVSDVDGLVSIVPVLDYKNLGGELKVLVR